MNYTKTQALPWGRYALFAMSALFATFLVLYVVLVFKTVFYTAAKQRLHVSISSISTNISDLESHYIGLQNNINADTASNLGFVKVTEKSYITRPALGLSNRPGLY